MASVICISHCTVTKFSLFTQYPLTGKICYWIVSLEAVIMGFIRSGVILSYLPECIEWYRFLFKYMLFVSLSAVYYCILLAVWMLHSVFNHHRTSSAITIYQLSFLPFKVLCAIFRFLYFLHTRYLLHSLYFPGVINIHFGACYFLSHCTMSRLAFRGYFMLSFGMRYHFLVSLLEICWVRIFCITFLWSLSSEHNPDLLGTIN